jgi:KAP family P-loop domain
MVSSEAGRRSPSVDNALRWAEACASLSGGGPTITPTDLFLGILIAHPDDKGEMRVLLAHFGLTARDMLPDDYPVVTPENLREAAKSVSRPSPDTWDPDVQNILDIADSTSDGKAQLAHVMGALLQRSTPFLERLEAGVARFGIQASQLASEFNAFLSSTTITDPDDPTLDLRSRITAGEQIGTWLATRFPRRPASMAAFASEAIDPESDYIGVGVEADAFAYLIASKALTPPLAIGLFGDWGSGKSFLMSKIRRRVRDLTGLARGGGTDIQVWDHVAEIEFSAWQYVETDLWAALLHHIFAKLTPTQLDELSQVDQARVVADSAITAQEKALGRARDRVHSLTTQQQRLAARNQEATAALEHTEQEVERLRDPLLTQALSAQDRARWSQQVAAGAAVLGPDAAAAMDASRRVVEALRKPAWRQSKYWTLRRVAATAACVALVPLVSLAVQVWADSFFATLASTLAVVLPAVVAGLDLLARIAEQHDADVQTAEREVDQKLGALVAAAARERNELADSLTEVEGELSTAVDDARRAKKEHEKLVQRREAITPGFLYTEFLAARNSSDDYRKRLGLVTTVHRDLEKLATLTEEYNTGVRADADRPPNRIVLYVDDLDRCPPNRVVEVLEAVHLLLAFKLFVVIVAVDTRWLTHALDTALPTLAETAEEDEGNAPTAIAYLEKIFQIPFWVEKLDDDGRQRLLRGLLMKSVSQPPASPGEAAGTALTVGNREQELVNAMLARHGLWLDLDASQLTITSDELAFIESLACLFEGTPREAKRFVNTCQLMLAMAPPLSGEGACPTERMASCFMTALHEAMPGLAAEVAGVEPETRYLATIQSVLSSTEYTEHRGRVNGWLLKHNGLHGHHDQRLFEDNSVDVFLKRWEVIQRLRFTMAPEPAKPPAPSAAE